MSFVSRNVPSLLCLISISISSETLPMLLRLISFKKMSLSVVHRRDARLDGMDAESWRADPCNIGARPSPRGAPPSTREKLDARPTPLVGLAGNCWASRDRLSLTRPAILATMWLIDWIIRLTPCCNPFISSALTMNYYLEAIGKFTEMIKGKGCDGFCDGHSFIRSAGSDGDRDLKILSRSKVRFVRSVYLLGPFRTRVCTSKWNCLSLKTSFFPLLF